MPSIKSTILWGIFAWILFSAVRIGRKLYEVPPVPSLNEDAWWGPGEAKNLSPAIRPFEIKVPNEVIIDLNERLDRYLKMRKTPPLENSAFTYGFNSNYLSSVVTYWRNKYSWKEREKYLNKYPHFKTYVNGLDLHFIHVRPEKVPGKTVLPLLLCHGWPGSVREFYEIIPFLTTPRDDVDFVFELVIPSLPGYGFSEGSSKPGLGVAQMAVMMKKLMVRLGHDKFYVQGGDWGSQIAKYLGVLYPENILGVHGNMCFSLNPGAITRWVLGSFLPFLSSEEQHHYEKLYPLFSKVSFLLNELGYMHLQASKPDTIGIALSDTPVGLAAYILEKFSTWTNSDWMFLNDGGLTKKYSLDALLDNIMIYWITGSITTSQRLYAEAMNLKQMQLRMDEIPLKVPTACARFPREILWMSKPLLEGVFQNLVQVSDFDDGGHFAAFEVPKVLSEDIWKAVKKFQKLQVMGVKT